MSVQSAVTSQRGIRVTTASIEVSRNARCASSRPAMTTPTFHSDRVDRSAAPTPWGIWPAIAATIRAAVEKSFARKNTHAKQTAA